ncbi:hypothetical protein F4678DRAFT_475489 [Xylaria arbuscula]|nr:hypothetical protein F4678DRAFT_475489 [Xylaria arbuscula]
MSLERPLEYVVHTLTLSVKVPKVSSVTPDQLLQCRYIAAVEFGKSLSKEEYVEQEDYLAEQPLVADKGWHVWCLSLVQDPAQVLTTCKTISRELLIRDASCVSRQKAYYIANVATDPRYRGQGLASRLLEYVAGWLDGPGDAAASILYTSIADLYGPSGWKKLPAYLTTLSWPSSSLPLFDRASLPETRSVLSTDISKLCMQDVRDVENHMEKLLPPANESHVCVLPTANLITFLHARSDFVGTRIHGALPKRYGSMCESANSWLYWHHDFRKQQLAVQRVRVAAGINQTHRDAIVSLLLDAIEEACMWKFSKVILWDPSPELFGAMQILQEKFNIQSETVARDNKSVPLLRWRHADESNRIVFHFNEFYTRS